MWIDGPAFMYETFLCCRHAVGSTDGMLAALLPVLDIVRQTGALAVDADDPRLQAAAPVLASFALPLEVTPAARGALSPDAEPLFALVCAAAVDAARLWAAGSTHAVRSIGYAVHFLPGLLHEPDEFEPRLFEFSLRIAGADWGELSAELRRALCAVVRRDVEEVTRAMGQAGYPIDMWS